MALKAACEKCGSLLLHQLGIRIGLLIANDTTLVYVPTPLLIAEPSNKPNAIRLDTAAIPIELSQDGIILYPRFNIQSYKITRTRR